jgi:hypothetical protein
MARVTYLSNEGIAGQDFLITGLVQRPDMKPVDGTKVSSTKLTIVVQATSEIVNSRDHAVVGIAVAEIDGAGNLSLLLGPDDMAMLHPAQSVEVHQALLEIVYVDGTLNMHLAHSFIFKVFPLLAA